MDIIRFGTDDADNILSKEPERLETLPYGGVLLDRNGIIQRYNDAESRISGRAPRDVIGKNFFDDVATCSKKQPVYEYFKKFNNGETVNAVLRYFVELPQKKVDVKVHIKSNGAHCWLFIKRV